jgi:hypothetical protein
MGREVVLTRYHPFSARPRGTCPRSVLHCAVNAGHGRPYSPGRVSMRLLRGHVHLSVYAGFHLPRLSGDRRQSATPPHHGSWDCSSVAKTTPFLLYQPPARDSMCVRVYPSLLTKREEYKHRHTHSDDSPEDPLIPFSGPTSTNHLRQQDGRMIMIRFRFSLENRSAPPEKKALRKSRTPRRHRLRQERHNRNSCGSTASISDTRSDSVVSLACKTTPPAGMTRHAPVPRYCNQSFWSIPVCVILFTARHHTA